MAGRCVPPQDLRYAIASLALIQRSQAVSDILRDAEMRKERQPLEDISQSSMLHRNINALSVVEQDFFVIAAKGDLPGIGRAQSGD